MTPFERVVAAPLRAKLAEANARVRVAGLPTRDFMVERAQHAIRERQAERGYLERYRRDD